MDYKKVWNNITSNLYKNKQEFPTTPMKNITPVWFSAYSSNGRDIEITPATHNKPSCRISGARTLTEEEFKKIYPIHLRRENGESVSKDAQAVTFNQVYFYSLIKHLGNKTNK